MVVNPPSTIYALLVKWLTHLTFYQTFKGSSPLQGTIIQRLPEEQKNLVRLQERPPFNKEGVEMILILLLLLLILFILPSGDK